MDALAATGGCDTGAAIGDWFGLVGEENGEVEEGKRGAVYTRREIATYPVGAIRSSRPVRFVPCRTYYGPRSRSDPVGSRLI